MNKILYDFIASCASRRRCLVEILHSNIATISMIIVGLAATASETHKFILHLYSVKESQMCFHISLTYVVAHKFHPQTTSHVSRTTKWRVKSNENVTANVTVTLEYSNGQVYPTTVAVPPQSQYFFDVNAASASFPQSTSELSTEITSDAPIVAQRQEYFRFNQNIPGGTDVIGEPGPAQTSYSFSEFLTLQNPNTSGENVIVTLYLAHSITAQQIVTVGPQTRVTLNINSIVIPIVQSNPSAGYEVSLSVQAESGTIVAERPMYFVYGSNTAWGGTDVVGFAG